MKFRFSAFVLLAVLAVASLGAAPAAFAQDHGGGEGEGETAAAPSSNSNWDEAQDVTIWSIAAIAGMSAVLGVFYLLKRKVGGFPANPAWVAPIMIRPASELPGDDDEPHGHGHGEGHEAHESHAAPAH